MAAVADHLKAGAVAPDFNLNATPDQTISLRELRGRPVVLAFYPADWSPVCGDEMALFNATRHEIERYGAVLLGISVDSVWSHTAFADNRKLHFPLLADFEPKGAVAKSYGVYRDADGTSERALFVIDEAGVVRWSYVSPIAINPGVDGVLDALDRLPKAASPKEPQ
ncbi:redoxin domain-containing protein [Cupriavidus plantarum]|uniref:redoxin domain-containing protein n=1 Tax=Cupriavidus plantarum TaxID=942865 RepID=UPI001AFF3075|nr:redoxin domain-containing protein [Cupriavidus plantarum]CAG2135392.1 Peroxiredoxin [Cupriavidus plantarum]SMR84563.1 Peroxiredoxin [Cupriavidus plantarum]